MKQVLKNLLPFLFFIILLVPVVSFAQSGSNVVGASGGNATCTPGQICNPLKYTSIQAIVSALLTAVEYIGGIICALWIIWAGFLFVKAQGNPEKIEEAKSTITHAVIGTAIILGASVILTIITNTIAAIKS